MNGYRILHLLRRALLPAALGLACLTTPALTSCSTAGPHSGLKARDLDSALTYAASIYDQIPAGAPAQASLEAEYRAAMKDVLKSLKQEAPLRQCKDTISLQGWSIHFPLGTQLLAVPPAWCDDILLADAKKFKFKTRVAATGTGLPVMMYQAYDPARSSGVKLFPLNGRYLPATMIAEFTGPRSVTLTFHHTAKITRTRLKKMDRPLAYDLSAPLARSMDSGFLSGFAGKGLFRAQDLLDDTGIFVPGIYDPDKIPVVFVHGLASDPHIWDNAMNEVLADPVLRQKFQPWYFLYPTGMPAQLSAAKLRSGLKRAVEHYSRQGGSRTLSRMVLVGHSMGGLISHMQVVDSGEDIYQAWFTRPLDSLRIQPANRTFIRDTLYFQHLPFVRRAIFVATPHRGSVMADLRIVRFALRLVKRLVRVDELITDVVQNAANAINPGLFWTRGGGGRSVDTLAASHPMLPALARRPITVPWHNIIAVWKPKPKLEDTTDGAVPYTSSYLPGAESDFIVRAFHSCTENPDVMAEICRILRLHARRY